jgi:hypothetical protein
MVQAQQIRNTKIQHIEKHIMKSISNDKITQWQKSLSWLNWGPKHAERSARLALSQAAWLGIDRDVAIQAVFEMGLDGFFRANPHIPLHTWQSVTEQIACPDECALVAA